MRMRSVDSVVRPLLANERSRIPAAAGISPLSTAILRVNRTTLIAVGFLEDRRRKAHFANVSAGLAACVDANRAFSGRIRGPVRVQHRRVVRPLEQSGAVFDARFIDVVVVVERLAESDPDGRLTGEVQV